MIPPVEVRQIRPCELYTPELCMMYDDESLSCELKEPAFTNREKHYWDFANQEPDDISREESNENYDRLYIEGASLYPCKYHMTHAEYRELIDSGVVE